MSKERSRGPSSKRIAANMRQSSDHRCCWIIKLMPRLLQITLLQDFTVLGP